MNDESIDREPTSGYQLAAEPDWSVETPRRLWDPSRRLIGCLRDYARARKQGGPIGYLRAKVAVLRHRLWSVVTGADIPLNTWNIAGGLELPHANGVVIHPEAKVGPNCRIFQQVTLGTGSRPGVPVLGANVHVGAGAKILGGVQIGDNAVIGANAVVIADVPSGAIAVGVPAKVKPHARGDWDYEARSRRGNQISGYPAPPDSDVDRSNKAS